MAVIDTHEVVKELTAAGFTENQAEALSRVVRQVQTVDASILATRTDVVELKSDLQKALAETKVEILKWMVSTMGLQTVVIIGAVITLARLLH